MQSVSVSREDRFAAWMATARGRGVRIAAGVVLIGLGLFALRGRVGVVLAVVGLVPLAAGVLNWCLLAPILRAPFRGRDAQRRCAARSRAS